MTEKVGPTARTYDVCLSFAAEQRHYVAEVARLLRNDGIAVFYDEYETVGMFGRDLYTHLRELYGRDSRYCVLFASADYARKVWTNHERMSAQERALLGRDDYVLPVRMDDTEIPGLPRTTGHIDARGTSPAELARMIVAKVDTTVEATAMVDAATEAEETPTRRAPGRSRRPSQPSSRERRPPDQHLVT